MAVFLKRHLFFELIVLAAGTMAVLVLNWQSPAISQTDTGRIKGYGGRLPAAAVAVLVQMQQDLESSNRLLEAGSERIVFIDRSGNRRGYCYLYGTLWRDDFPALSDVLAFHFEYRDGQGNTTVFGNGNSHSIESVGYTMRIADGRRHILTGSKVPVRFRPFMAAR